MILSMVLAHLVGDYVLQWDKLAAWKARELRGILVHALVVAAVTFAFVLPFEPFWWQGALFISAAHLLIDVVQLPVTRRPAPSGAFAFGRFVLDQVAHAASIILALIWGGFLDPNQMLMSIAGEVYAQPTLVYIVGYTALAMPAWVALEFTLFYLVKGSPPDFSQATNKYVSSLERWLIVTSVLLGQYLLVLLIAAPRFLFERPQRLRAEDRDGNMYVARLLASALLAVAVGLALRYVL